MTAEPLMTLSNLSVSYGRARSERVVLKDISLTISKGETLGLVGESGSGKTTIGRAILGLTPVKSGKIEFDGLDTTAIPRRQRRDVAGSLQVIFQDPYSSLNPSMTIEDILIEPLMDSGAPARSRVRDLLERVGLPKNSGQRYAVEFSGGQRQRIAIARALAVEPKLIICDEPTSALDVTTQARVLALLKEIQVSTNVAYLFISHDLGVVRQMSDRIAVLHSGSIVETGSADQVALHPQHSYSRRLQLATPVPDPERQRARRELFRASRGEVAGVRDGNS